MPRISDIIWVEGGVDDVGALLTQQLAFHNDSSQAQAGL